MNTHTRERFVQGTVVENKEWRPGLHSLFVTATIEPFIAGQFSQLGLDEELRLLRPYSFVNPPSQATLEFYYSLIPGGRFSTKLIALLPGDKIFIAKHAFGRFTLDSVPDADSLWLFATGTGLGVFLSILQTPEPWQRFQKIVLVHSVQTVTSLTHLDLIRQWQQQFPRQFQWIPVVTGGNHPGVFSERVTVLLTNGQLEEKAELQIATQTSQVMLCGNPAMIHDVCEILHQRGLTLNHLSRLGHITIENYWKLLK